MSCSRAWFLYIQEPLLICSTSRGATLIVDFTTSICPNQPTNSFHAQFKRYQIQRFMHSSDWGSFNRPTHMCPTRPPFNNSPQSIIGYLCGPPQLRFFPPPHLVFFTPPAALQELPVLQRCQLSRLLVGRSGQDDPLFARPSLQQKIELKPAHRYIDQPNNSRLTPTTSLQLLLSIFTTYLYYRVILIIGRKIIQRK